MFKNPHLKLFLIALLALTLMLPGCGSKLGKQQTKVHYYPQCYQPIQQLREDENLVAKSTATGAVGGALVGALIGGLTTGKIEGALAGAAAGGVAGAAGGYAYGKAQQQKRDEAFYKKYASALDEDITSMTRTIAAAKVARQCYDQQFKQLIEDYKRGAITAEERDKRYAEIRSGLQEISYILQQKYDDMSTKDAEYEQAILEDPTATPEMKKKYKKDYNEVKTRVSKRRTVKTEVKTNKEDIDKSLVDYARVIASSDSKRNKAA